MWMVRLTGDTPTLVVLAQTLTGSDINVSFDNQWYALMSDQFSSYEEEQEVRKKAEDIIAALNINSHLALTAMKPIKIVDVYRLDEDGKHHWSAWVSDTIEFRDFPFAAARYMDGTLKECPPVDSVDKWIQIAAKDNAIHDVFLLLERTLDWVNLYRIYEIIRKDVGGYDSFRAKGWAREDSLNLFRDTCNNPGAVGLDARHGVQSKQPPPNPMRISEARALIKSIVHKWLCSKTTG